MPYALLTPDGHIRQIIVKPSPFMKLADGERMVNYNPPALDEELAFALPVQPVPPDNQAVSFTVQAQPADVVKAVWIARTNKSVQLQLDAQAQSMGYDNMLSAVSYAGSTHPQYGPEGLALRIWRDECWDVAFSAVARVKAGQAAPDSLADVTLPVFCQS